MEQHAPRKQSMSRGKKIGLVVGGLFVLFLLLDALNHQLSNTTISSNTASITQTTASAPAKPSPAEQRQATIDKYAPLYCKNHPNLRMSNNFFTDNQGWPLFNGTRAWTAAECEAIIGKLYDTGSNDEHLQTLANGKYAIGMTLHELIYAVGVPTDWHTTHISASSQQQLVYGDPLYNATYIYLENGVITSVQN